MKTGPALINDINAATPDAGTCGVWWLGQHSFVVKAAGRVIYLDPFLSPYDGRLVPPLLAPSDVTNATLVCGTHDHADHIDRDVWPGIAAASPACHFVVPGLLRGKLAADLRIPLDRLVGIDDGAGATVDSVKITGIAAAHEFLDQDPATGRYPYLGYVVEVGGLTLYHAGDCCNYEGLLTRLRKWKLDIVFLPINGRDAKRYASGCIGNMTYQEAADLAGSLAPRLTIPAHFDMFATNLGDANAFRDYMAVKYPALPVRIPEYGRFL